MRKNFLLLTLFVLVTFFNTLPIYGITPAEAPSFFSPTPVAEVDYILPYPGILPDHPLYFLKKLRDKILLFLTQDPVRKGQVYLLLADKKLVMGQLLWEEGKLDLSVAAFSEAEEELLKAADQVIVLEDEDNLPVGLADKVSLAAEKHQEVIGKKASYAEDGSHRRQLEKALDINKKAIEKLTTVK